MKRVLGVLLAAFIGVGAFVGIANAQAPANCGVALDLLLDARAELGVAQKAFDDLPDTVKGPKVPGPEVDNPALPGLTTARDEALQAVVDSGTGLTEPDFNQGGIDLLTEQFPSTSPQNQDFLNAQEQIWLIRLFMAADEALKAAPAKVPGPKVDGPRIPNPDLKAGSEFDRLKAAKVAVAKAQADANVACQGASGSPGAPPPPPTDDFDCVDFPLADGTTAQGMLNRTLPEDPHNLDANNNGIACEVVIDYNSNNNNVTPQQVTQVPVGGVATGDGSSL